MKVKQKTKLTLGGFIAAAYQAWGVDRAAHMVRLMSKARLVLFQAQPHSAVSFAKGSHV